MRSLGGRGSTPDKSFARPGAITSSFLLTRRPFGYSGVSAIQSRPFSSQSIEITFSINGSDATRLIVKFSGMLIFAAAFSGAVGPPGGYLRHDNSSWFRNLSASNLAVQAIPRRSKARTWGKLKDVYSCPG